MGCGGSKAADDQDAPQPAGEAVKDEAAAELQGAASEYLAAKKKKKEEDAAAADLQGAAAGYLAAKRAKAAEASGAEEPGFGEQVGAFFGNITAQISQRFAPAEPIQETKV